MWQSRLIARQLVSQSMFAPPKNKKKNSMVFSGYKRATPTEISAKGVV